MSTEAMKRPLAEVRYVRRGVSVEEVPTVCELPLDPCLIDLGLKPSDCIASLDAPPRILDDNPRLDEYRGNEFVVCKIGEAAAATAGRAPGFYRLRCSPQQLGQRIATLGVEMKDGTPDESSLRSILPPQWGLGRCATKKRDDGTEGVIMCCVAVIPDGKTGDDLRAELVAAVIAADYEHFHRTEGPDETPEDREEREKLRRYPPFPGIRV